MRAVYSQPSGDIRTVEAALGDGVKRVYDSEQPILRKLRRVQSVHA